MLDTFELIQPTSTTSGALQDVLIVIFKVGVDMQNTLHLTNNSGNRSRLKLDQQ